MSPNPDTARDTAAIPYSETEPTFDSCAKFTPGPWRCRGDDHGVDIFQHRGMNTGPLICVIPWNKGVAASADPSAANADLIAAAPEGFAVAVFAYRRLLTLSPADSFRMAPQQQQLMASLRDYIAKATGRTAEAVQTEYEGQL